MSRLTISDTAERYIETWADQYERGELSITDLPRSLQRLVFIGLGDGLAIANEQAREYERQLDRLWLAAFSPKDRREELQRRLDEHFRLEEQRFFAVEEESTNGSSSNNRIAA